MKEFIQHFRKEEQPFVEKVIDWKQEVENRYYPKLTDFLDPRERFIVQSIIKSNDELFAQSEGIFEQAERQRMIIYPSYFQPKKEDYNLMLLSFRFPSKFVQIQHPQVLGALLSLGLNREKFGDIRVMDDVAQFVICKEVFHYVQMNLTSVGKTKISLDIVEDQTKIIRNTERWIESMHTISSMRIDNILSTILNLSRAKAQMYISSEKVKVNWKMIDENSFEVKEGDLLSIRGFGRFKIMAVEGKTKKGKIRLKVGKLDKK